MSYEEPEPYVVNDENGDYCFQCATLEEAKLKFIEDANDLDSVNKLLAHGDKSTINLTTHTAEFDVTADDHYILHPTEAWQQLQDDLRQGREAVEKLPLTADGVRVSWGDQVWFYDDLNEKLIWGVIEMIEDIRDADISGDFNFVGSMPDEEIPFQSPNIYCYSSKESCLSSIKEQRESK